MSIRPTVKSLNRWISDRIESSYYNLRGIRDELKKPKPDFESINTHYLHINGYINEILGLENCIKAMRKHPDKSVIESKYYMLEELIVLTSYVKIKYNKYI